MSADLLARLDDDDKRTLLVLLMEDIRGSFDGGSFDRTHAVIALAKGLGYDQVRDHARAYLDSDWDHDGRHLRIGWSRGGYEDPPFDVTRIRATASPELCAAVDGLCDHPEYRLDDGR